MKKYPLFLLDEWYEKLEEEVFSWLGTPYHNMWYAKQVGCDCNTFIGGVLLNLNLITKLEIEYYPNCWWEAEEYSEIINFYIQKHKRFANENLTYKFFKYYPSTLLMRGDILHFSLLSGKKNIINHSAILLENNKIVHVTERKGVTLDDLNLYIKKLRKITRIYLVK